MVPSEPHLSRDEIALNVTIARHTVRLHTFGALLFFGAFIGAAGSGIMLSNLCLYGCEDSDASASEAAMGAGLAAIGLGTVLASTIGLITVGRRRRNARHRAELGVAPLALHRGAGVRLGATW
ncbi:MAG: hypothetical protein KC593_00115 [Myxococcales bacterium]|nr:hypothetical protein [Myxococcales bacterium]MCB9628712.1 hypothetical protein [Sandaracinaceae bacterium]